MQLHCLRYVHICSHWFISLQVDGRHSRILKILRIVPTPCKVDFSISAFVLHILMISFKDFHVFSAHFEQLCFNEIFKTLCTLLTEIIVPYLCLTLTAKDGASHNYKGCLCQPGLQHQAFEEVDLDEVLRTV